MDWRKAYNPVEGFLKGKNSVILFFLLAFIVRFYVIPPPEVLFGDDREYIRKGVEFAKGNFHPLPDHEVGWPLFLSIFFYLFPQTDFSGYLVEARLISVLIASLSVFPLAWIARRVVNSGVIWIVPLLLFVFQPNLIKSSVMGYSEPFFTFNLLLTFYFMLRIRDNIWYLIPSAFWGGLTTITRSNGIIMLCIFLVSWTLILKDRKRGLRWPFLIALVLLVLVTVPVYFIRYTYYGSPLEYNLSSRFLVDKLEDRYDPSVRNPGFIEYITTRPANVVFRKFMVRGLFRVIYDFIFHSLTPLFLPFFLLGVIKGLKIRKLHPMLLLYLLWISSMAGYYDIYPTLRFFFPLIPFDLIFFSLGFSSLIQDEKARMFCLTYLLTVLLVELRSVVLIILNWTR